MGHGLRMKSKTILRAILPVGSALLLVLASAWGGDAADVELEKVRTAAEKGDAAAQYRLGQAYLRGLGVLKDLPKAYELIRQAAEQGHAEALGGVGYFYAQGIKVPKDLAEAVAWFRKGAEKGGAKAQINLGQALAYGRGVAVDEAEGLQWIERAAAQGLPHAIYVQGEFHFHGKFGRAQDYGKALPLFLKAAEADDASAQNMLGVMFQDGLGMPIDLAQAEAWFRKAAEQGDAKAQSNLGQLLGPEGPDASKHVEALKWLMLANRTNEPVARNLLNQILRHVPEAEKTEAQRQVAAFRARPSAADAPH